tara:strand:+ start:4208 stop:4804 length:597 start_codon:yes stop_codon:yes gene_type:complete
MPNKNNFFNIANYYYIIKKQSGMSMIEVIITMTLLSLFFTFYAIFVDIASRYNDKEQNNLENSNGLTIDQHYLSITLDKYTNFLSQPGMTLTEINTIKSQKVEDLPAGCTFSPSIDWQIPIKQKPISNVDWQPSNAGYAICLKPTSIVESSLSDLISKSNGNSIQAQPGLYFLLALPNEVSINKLPIRKLFCRPHPYC